MSNKVKVKLDRAGVRKLLKSQEMLQICKDHAYSAQAKLGSGYEVTFMTGKNRANAQIEAVTWRAKLANIRNNTILKALK